MTNVPDCPICQTPNPWESTDADMTYCYKDQEFSLTNVAYSVCRVCGFDVVLPRQRRETEARIRDEHRRIDGLLTGAQIKVIRNRLGLTQADAARLFGGGQNAFSKYERGEVIQSVAMDQLLRVLAALSDEDRRNMLAILESRSGSSLIEHEQPLPSTEVHLDFAA